MMPLVIEGFPMWIAHILRGICIIFGPFAIILSGRLSRASQIAKHRRYIFGGVSLLLMSSTYTEIVKWNDVVTPRLFVNFGGTILVVIGLYKMIEYQRGHL